MGLNDIYIYINNHDSMSVAEHIYIYGNIEVSGNSNIVVFSESQ